MVFQALFSRKRAKKNIVWKLPERIQGEIPAAVLLPGFHPEGTGVRMEEASDMLNVEGMIALSMDQYSFVQQNGQTLRPDFTLGAMRQDISNIFHELVHGEHSDKVDRKKISLIASSVSAGVVPDFLLNGNLRELEIDLAGYLALSPMVNWEYSLPLLKGDAKDYVNEIPLKLDNGFTLIFGGSALSNLQKVDALDTLDNLDVDFPVMTVYGLNDTLSSPAGIQKYHEKFSKNRNIVGIIGEKAVSVLCQMIDIHYKSEEDDPKTGEKVYLEPKKNNYIVEFSTQGHNVAVDDFNLIAGHFMAHQCK